MPNIENIMRMNYNVYIYAAKIIQGLTDTTDHN